MASEHLCSILCDWDGLISTSSNLGWEYFKSPYPIVVLVQSFFTYVQKGSLWRLLPSVNTSLWTEWPSLPSRSSKANEKMTFNTRNGQFLVFFGLVNPISSLGSLLSATSFWLVYSYDLTFFVSNWFEYSLFGLASPLYF